MPGNPYLIGLIALGIILIITIIILLKRRKKDSPQVKIKAFNKNLKKYAKGRDFLLLNDVFLPIDSMNVVMIDNLIVGNKYLYVISQKNWEGKLKGYEYDTKWLLMRKNQTFYVNNPLIANRFRVNALLKFLNEEDENSIVNIIALNDKIKFDEVTYQPKEKICKASDTFKIIDKYEKNSNYNDIASDEQERIANLINDESRKIQLERKKGGRNDIK